MQKRTSLARLSFVGLVGLALACSGPEDQPALLQQGIQGSVSVGASLFRHEPFGTNGRTCETCHLLNQPGTIGPSEIQASFAAEGLSHPLFRIIDADDLDNDDVIDGDLNGNGIADPGEPITYNRLLTHATIRVRKELPPNVRIVGSDARFVVLNRGIPSMFNVSALDPLLMYDGRNGRMACSGPPPGAPAPFFLCVGDPDTNGDGFVTFEDVRLKLVDQARGAVFSHFQPSAVPDPTKLEAIADFQATLFNGTRAQLLQAIAQGAPAPATLDEILPHSNNPVAEAGRAHFLETGLCGACHGGPLLDKVPVGSPIPPGVRFLSVGVSEFNRVLGQPRGTFNPVHTFEFTEQVPDPNNPGQTVTRVTRVTTPDPGLALVTGRSVDANLFRTTSLWNIKKTAPYFHNNSARTLDEVVEHYDQFFRSNGVAQLTPQQKAQMVAYMTVL